jgi:hypothetical protein
MFLRHRRHQAALQGVAGSRSVDAGEGGINLRGLVPQPAGVGGARQEGFGVRTFAR